MFPAHRLGCFQLHPSLFFHQSYNHPSILDLDVSSCWISSKRSQSCLWCMYDLTTRWWSNGNSIKYRKHRMDPLRKGETPDRGKCLLAAEDVRPGARVSTFGGWSMWNLTAGITSMGTSLFLGDFASLLRFRQVFHPILGLSCTPTIRSHFIRPGELLLLERAALVHQLNAQVTTEGGSEVRWKGRGGNLWKLASRHNLGPVDGTAKPHPFGAFVHSSHVKTRSCHLPFPLEV